MKEQMTEFEKQLIKNLIDINFSLAKISNLIEGNIELQKVKEAIEKQTKASMKDNEERIEAFDLINGSLYEINGNLEEIRKKVKK